MLYFSNFKSKINLLETRQIWLLNPNLAPIAF